MSQSIDELLQILPTEKKQTKKISQKRVHEKPITFFWKHWVYAAPL